VREPRPRARRRGADAAFFAELELSFSAAEAEARADIHDVAQAIESCEIVAPGIGLVAVQLAQERVRGVRCEHRFDFAAQCHGFFGGPLRNHASVD